MTIPLSFQVFNESNFFASALQTEIKNSNHLSP